MGDAIEQAADVIRQISVEQGDDIDCCAPYAEGLVEAGLLVTPEQQAVIDAAEAWRDAVLTDGGEAQLLARAVDALRAARKETP